MGHAERRRCDRLAIVLPLRIEGKDALGRAFRLVARTIDISPQGARIRTSLPLPSGQVVRCVNSDNGREADFRVTGPAPAHGDEGGEYSLESVDGRENIWGIQFPSASGREGEGRRDHARLRFRMPLLIRDYSGEVERTETVDVSKGGFSFVSETSYLLRQSIMVACPYSPCGQNIEVPARIARWKAIEGTGRALYGVRYEAPAR